MQTSGRHNHRPQSSSSLDETKFKETFSDTLHVRTAEIFDREALSRLKSSEVIIRNDVNIYEPRGMRHSHI